MSTKLSKEETFEYTWGRLSKSVFKNSVKQGFWEGEVNDGERMALIHAEISEALEALRDGNPSSSKIIEFSSLEEELADAVIRIMDYAFGEQTYETMDELLKPFKCKNGKKYYLNVDSVSIMGKAGILEGGKGDIMIPSAHIFEGTADNYPFKNQLKKSQFEGCGVDVYTGAMVTVLGTSLQNKDILKFFHDSTWKVTGLEMEGAHYQKAIQAASKIRGNISRKVKVRYAYYASDNPLETGSTLASGGLGTTGVLPTYVITQKILEQIF